MATVDSTRTYYPRDDRDVLHAALLLRAALHGAYVPHILARILSTYTPHVRALADTSLTRTARYDYSQRFVLCRVPVSMPADPPPVLRLELRFWTRCDAPRVAYPGPNIQDEANLVEMLDWDDDVFLNPNPAAEGPPPYLTCKFAIARKPAHERLSWTRAAWQPEQALLVHASSGAHADFCFADGFDVADGELDRELFAPFLLAFGPGDVLVLEALCAHAMMDTHVRGVDARLYVRSRVDFERMVVLE